ncbi:MAG: COG1361 S-layer family protein [Halorubrum sp.]
MSNGFRAVALVGAVALVVLLVTLGGAAAPVAADDGRAALTGSPDGDGLVAQSNGSGLVRGEPDLDVYVSQPTVASGSRQSVTVDILNTGEMSFGKELDPRVTTARGLTLEADDEDVPIEVDSGETAVGDVSTRGGPVSVPLDITVPDDVPDGSYDVEVTAEYRYTYEVNPSSTLNNHKDRRGSDDFDITIVVDDGARFAILETDTDAQVGGSGDVTATLRNVGDEVARDAVVTGRATGSTAVIGGGRSGEDDGAGGSGESYVGDWEPGENRTVTFDSTVSSDFGDGAYAFVSTVDYRDRDGIESTSPSSRAGVVPVPEQSFGVGDVEGTLEVGYSGTVSGTLTNEGPLDVDDAVLVADSQSDRVSLGESRYALPEVPAGESVDFSFDADVNGDADPGPRQFRFTTEYSSGDSTIAVDETRRVEVAPRRPEFDLTVDNATVPAGETRRIAVEITNQRPETLSSINAGLYADSPLSADNDEAFVDELEPGESTEIWFEVSAASDASVETHPIELDFRYDDERGDDRISDVTQVPVEVTEAPDDGGLPTAAIAVGLLLVVAGAGAVVWYRRR